MDQHCISEKPIREPHVPEVFAIDIDGTITFNDHTISDFTVSEFKKLKKDYPNVKFILVTGRSYKNAHHVCKKLEILDNYLITNNGSVLTTVHEFKPIIQKIINLELVEAVFDYCKKNDLTTAALFGSGEEVLIPKFVKHHNKMFSWLGDSQIIDDFNKIYSENIYQICVFGDIEVIEKTVIQLEKIGANVWVYERGDKFALEINGPTTDKWSMIEKYCKKNNYNLNNVVVMGNGTNDVPMFEHATYSVAVKNAVDILHKLATEVCLSNEENGVVKFIRQHLQKFYPSK